MQTNLRKIALVCLLVVVTTAILLLEEQAQNPVADIATPLNPNTDLPSTDALAAPEQIAEPAIPILDASERTATPVPSRELYEVIKVVDGDTIDVRIGTTIERVRLIGINTPETVDPRTEVECFGHEASTFATQLLRDQYVSLETEPAQEERDKYGRLLRYVFLEDGTHVNYELILGGYAYEYTYSLPYQYQTLFKKAETEARAKGAGLWGAKCEQPENTPSTYNTPPDPQCTIKGNINLEGEKIYHLEECEYYSRTRIDTHLGEQWFCSESEATDAGWRKAGNCP